MTRSGRSSSRRVPHQLSVLLVEDDELDAEMFVREVQKIPLVTALHHAEDGLEALEMLRTGEVKRPRVVVLDVNMPRMNGHDFLDALRADEVLHATPVFMLTTSDLARDRCRAFERHVAGYVLKSDPNRTFAEAMAKLGDFWGLSEQP